VRLGDDAFEDFQGLPHVGFGSNAVALDRNVEDCVFQPHPPVLDRAVVEHVPLVQVGDDQLRSQPVLLARQLNILALQRGSPAFEVFSFLCQHRVLAA